MVDDERPALDELAYLLDADPDTTQVVVVSKPPAPKVAEAVRAHAASLSTPVRFALLGPGMDPDREVLVPPQGGGTRAAALEDDEVGPRRARGRGPLHPALPVPGPQDRRRRQPRPPCSRSGIPAAHRAAAMRAGWPNSRARRRPSVSSPKPSLRSAYCPMFPG